ncbi:mas-related G-protein coupled receptor member H-like [Theristicus caerulescens]
MELNHMSPSPTPPTPTTDGDEPCMIDVTDMAINSVLLLICFCGLMGNGAVIRLVCSLIRRNPITNYILNLTAINFSFLLIMATLSLLYMMENAFCSAVVPLMYQSSLFLLPLLSYNMGMYLLTAISIERCMSILCPLWHRCRRPQHLSAVVCALLWALSITFVAAMASLCTWHDHEHCQRALISMYVLNFFIFAPAMVISNGILFFKVLCGSRRHQPKRLYIVIFLTVLFFLIFGVPLSIWSFLQQFSYTVVPNQVVFLLACINSSINPFIYFLVGSCQRRCSLVSLQVAFQRVFEEPEDNTARSNDTTMDTLAPAS